MERMSRFPARLLLPLLSADEWEHDCYLAWTTDSFCFFLPLIFHNGFFSPCMCEKLPILLLVCLCLFFPPLCVFIVQTIHHGEEKVFLCPFPRTEMGGKRGIILGLCCGTLGLLMCCSSYQHAFPLMLESVWREEKTRKKRIMRILTQKIERSPIQNTFGEATATLVCLFFRLNAML